jgi:hypothetical protein
MKVGRLTRGWRRGFAVSLARFGAMPAATPWLSPTSGAPPKFCEFRQLPHHDTLSPFTQHKRQNVVPCGSRLG